MITALSALVDKRCRALRPINVHPVNAFHLRGDARQLGVSLISLMVGLLLSMIGILAGLTLYKNIVQTTVQTRSDALQDGQIASALLTLQLELQSAGYGLANDPTKTHVARSAAGDAIYWRQNTGTLQCKGFRIHTSADGLTRQLHLLKLASGTCNETAALASLNWAADNILAEFRKSEATGLNLPQFTTQLNATASCFPYGMGVKGTHPMVTITAENAAITAAKTVDITATGPNAPFRYDFCLSNL